MNKTIISNIVIIISYLLLIFVHIAFIYVAKELHTEVYQLIQMSILTFALIIISALIVTLTPISYRILKAENYKILPYIITAYIFSFIAAIGMVIPLLTMRTGGESAAMFIVILNIPAQPILIGVLHKYIYGCI